MNLGTPWMLLLLPLVALVAWFMVRSRHRQRDAASRLKGVAAEGGRGRLTRKEWLILASLACIVLALARPRWSPRPYDLERRGRDLVIAVDVSRSMLAADTFPSRLEMARIAIQEALPALGGQPLALVTFAGSASVRVPLTLDHGFVRYILERAGPADETLGSTSLEAAFEKVAATVLADATAGGRDLIVFTDGEDHLSDLDKTAELLAQCGARVLIIGLGDPTVGARVPDPRDESQWMQHDNVEVVSRLEEGTLTELAEACSNVTYFPARTRPFDLVSLYQQWIAEAGDDVVVGGVRQVRYTEGYPYLLGLAVLLWLASSSAKLPKMHGLILLALLLPGCAPRSPDDREAAFRARFEKGEELLAFAEEQSGADVLAERSLLDEAREEFLCAALLKSGHLETARRITTISRRLHELDTAIEQQRVEEKQRGEKLAQTIQRLEKLTARQERLSQRSQGVLRRIPIPSGEAANRPDDAMDDEFLALHEELNKLAPPISKEQQAVQKGTKSVLDRLTVQRDKLRQILKQAYGNVEELPPTEVDPIVDLLTSVMTWQDRAMESLASGAVVWPRANTALRTAAGRMQQACEALHSLLPPATDDEEESRASRNAGDYEEVADGLDAGDQDAKSQAAAPADFQEALLLQSLPIPDYTAAEILAEEAANQEKRARRKAVRAGAKVEKNW